MIVRSPSAFDVAAATYDERFTQRRLGRWLRAAVWAELGRAFAPGAHILELGCGTGEDAVWLARRGVRVLAADASPAMLELAGRKATAAGVAELVTLAQLDLGDLDASGQRLGVAAGSGDQGWGTQAACGEPWRYDGAFSNFGALNCIEDRRGLAAALAQVVRPGGLVVLVLMGPLCAWEIAWHLLHGELRTAFRRLGSSTLAQLDGGAALQVWYPGPRRLRAEFGAYFAHRETRAVGALLPPSQLAALVDRWPACFGTLALLERRLARRAPFAWLADHYLMVFERKELDAVICNSQPSR